MNWLDERISEQFWRWEARGRGGTLYQHPVTLEPPFVPFSGYSLPPAQDEGRQETRISRWWSRMVGAESPPGEEDEPEEEPSPNLREACELTEIQLTLPKLKPFTASAHEEFLRRICAAGELIAFEIIATSNEIIPQFAMAAGSAGRLDLAISQSFPGTESLPVHGTLSNVWQGAAAFTAIADIGMGAEFIVPLGDPRGGVLSNLAQALDDLHEGECAVYQLLFEPTSAPWEDSITRAVRRKDGSPLFANRPDLASCAERKISSPLLAVRHRFAACADNPDRAWEIVREMASPFASLAQRGTNYLTPLPTEEYPPQDRESDLLQRLSRRSGMLLCLDEFIPLLFLPTASISRRLRRATRRTRPAPESVLHQGSVCLGSNCHAGKKTEVWLSTEHRVRHTHLIGTSGSGKSTLILNMVRQDIENGQGLAVLDPHGDLIENVLGSIPPERFEDVVLVDPADEDHVVAFNILAAHSDAERELLASDLVSAFRRLSSSWGDQMNSVLRNAILAFLESSEGGTLVDLRRFLLDASFRNRFLATVSEPEIDIYWRHAFPQLTGNKSIGPVLTRLDEFLGRRQIRLMVAQKENRLDFSDILDRGRILLVKLAHGQIGKENSYLLGSVFVSKIQQAAMARQRMPESERRDFWCYIDEFPNFLTPSMAEILSGARKYRLGLVLAHQEFRQLEADRDVMASVLANSCTRIAFHVSDSDARALESGFSDFDAADLQSLKKGNAICRVERSDCDLNLAVPLAQEVSGADARRRAAADSSHSRYARPRAEVEEELRLKWQEQEMPLRNKKTKAPNNATEKAPPWEVEPAAEAESVRSSPAEIAPKPRALEDPPSTKPTDPLAAAVEIQPINASESEATETRTARELPDLGRGGAQHQAIQQRLKLEAEALGFRAILEKETSSRRGSINILLKRPPHQIACEISISTTIDHEVGNVSKCLKAGYTEIAVICTDAAKLAKIEAAVKNSLGQEAATRTRYFNPDELVAHLRALPPPPPTPKPEKRRGYTVKRNVVQISPEELRQREKTALAVIRSELQGK